MKIGIIGNGNVSWHLTKGLLSCPTVELTWIFKRNNAEVDEEFPVPYIHEWQTLLLNPVDLVIICVNDDAIQNVIDILPNNWSIAYTSGTVSLDKLNINQTNIGVFYPLQTFTIGKNVALNEVPFLIEANNKEFENVLFSLAKQLSENVELVNSEQRKQLHIAAVFTNNFVNHMLHLAKIHLEEHQLDDQLLVPLLDETIKKYKELGAFKAQSGPARRNDKHTITLHEKELKDYTRQVYHTLSESILKTYKQ